MSERTEIQVAGKALYTYLSSADPLVQQVRALGVGKLGASIEEQLDDLLDIVEWLLHEDDRVI